MLQALLHGSIAPSTIYHVCTHCTLHSSFLDDVGTAGERAQQYLELLQKLSDDSSSKWKSYLAMRGILPRIGGLITQEIDHLLVLEETTLSSDLSQGYALKMLTGWQCCVYLYFAYM